MEYFAWEDCSRSLRIRVVHTRTVIQFMFAVKVLHLQNFVAANLLMLPARRSPVLVIIVRIQAIVLVLKMERNCAVGRIDVHFAVDV